VDLYKSGRNHTYTKGEESASIFGMQNGIVLENTMQIDEDPWFQALSYSLRDFNTSDRHTMRFWLVRQDTLEPVKLSADKVAKEKNSLCNGEQAVTIEIRPVGLLSPFWHATYWFRKDDNVLCRYEGRHGAWGTPLTVISMKKDT